MEDLVVGRTGLVGAAGVVPVVSWCRGDERLVVSFDVGAELDGWRLFVRLGHPYAVVAFCAGNVSAGVVLGNADFLTAVRAVKRN